ncbi:2'-5' RNA ligase family protein [Anaerobacillus sp. HL2]|nr:2'-5' RNA ligase family protein [Anaerobacillus sp. HL2]
MIHFALIPPHITLREAFESNEEDIKNIITDLKNIANEAQPFSLTVYKYSSFTLANNTIFMGIKKQNNYFLQKN